jgi:hypothetical protein
MIDSPETISLAMEMLRVVPLAMALIRRFLPPNLTQKEKETTVFGISPLADPSEFELASSLAQIVRDLALMNIGLNESNHVVGQILNFVIMLVYAVIAPLTVFIQGFCFLAVSRDGRLKHLYSQSAFFPDVCLLSAPICKFSHWTLFRLLTGTGVFCLS